jgi:MYXO-CTERM domain-containing protein
MKEQNTEQEQDAGTCGPGCDCGTTGSGGRWRWIVGLIVLVATGALVTRAVVKDGNAPTAPVSTAFAALPTLEQTATRDGEGKALAPDAIGEIAELSELNAVAGDTAGVFVFLPGKTEATAVPAAILRGAARTIETQLGGSKIGMFTLKVGSQDYEQIASQTTMPGVLAMVKGGGMVPVSGDITETKLIQAYVAASSAGGCGPASAGCGPSGCN